MRPFALSVPGPVLGVHSHKGRQRDEQTRASSLHADSDAETQFSSTSRLPSETINPLSHTPDTLRQLAAAGLSPEDELPSLTHKRFPHAPLPTRKAGRRDRPAASPSRSLPYGSDGGATSGAETDATVTSQPVKKRPEEAVDVTRHSARMRHLGTMTAILHRCLRDGDIPRAKRAFGLLLRTRDVDIRLDNLWTIGSEILMRDGEEEEEVKRREEGVMSYNGSQKPSSSSSRGKIRGDSEAVSLDDSDSDSFIAETEDEELEELEELEGQRGSGEEEYDPSERKNPQPPRRWGSAANIAQVKLYFETLAQHHPHDPHRPRHTSAVDFWPALFGIELYNLDAEFQTSLHQIYTDLGFPSSSLSSSSFSPSSSRSASPSGDEYKMDRMDLDDDYNSNTNTMGEEMREERGRQEEEEKATRHAAIDALRAATQRGALEITSRMDAILENAPYTTHAELLRLRAHAALFIGDLYLPSRLIERYRRRRRRHHSNHHEAAGEIEGGEGGEGGGGRGETVTLREAERRLKAHVKTPEEHVALARRGEEQARARVFFRRVTGAKGGRLEGWILRSLDEEDEDED